MKIILAITLFLSSYSLLAADDDGTGAPSNQEVNNCMQLLSHNADIDRSSNKANGDGSGNDKASGTKATNDGYGIKDYLYLKCTKAFSS